MFSTIKSICKSTFSITKNTAELSLTVLGMVLSEAAEKAESMEYSSERSTKLEEKIKELHRILSTVSEELMMPFGGIELLKTKIIKFINNDIERINGEFNINIGFIESLSLEEFTRTISNINTNNLSINEIEALFNELDSIELVSKTNKDKIKGLLVFVKLSKGGIRQLCEEMQSWSRNEISRKNELIEILSNDEVFNKILSQ